MEIGIQDDAVFLNQAGYPRPAALDRAQEIGVTTIRANVLWSRVLTGSQANRRTRPAKPRYDFTLFDGLVDDARERGMKVELTLTGPAPRWATAEKVKVGQRGTRRRRSSRASRPMWPSTSRAASSATASGTSRTGTRG